MSGIARIGLEQPISRGPFSPRFRPPSTSPLHLDRERLVDLLRHDPASITLVCAPAGFGKTSLLAGWAAQSTDTPIAWLNLDRHDNDPGRLWAGILDALAGTAPMVARSLLQDLRAPADEVDVTFVDELMEQIARAGVELWLVLDDVHVLRHRTAIESLELLVEGSPTNLHLVLSGRSDPPVGVQRLRLRGALREIRAPDLAFTPDETAELVRRHEVSLSASDLEVLQAHTEGWVAGLQIACIAATGDEQPGAFVARFGGDDHEIAGYLLTEVMDGIPARTRRFMLRTSVCPELSVGLAQRLSDRADAAAVLDRLEQRNALTRRLGRGRDAYRYHDLLRSFLLAELQRDDPRVMRELQHTAAGWFAAQGDHLHAMEHLAAAGDGDQVVEMARQHGLTAILDGGSRRLYGILTELPAADQHQPIVALLLTAAALEVDQLPEADRWLALLDLDAIAGGDDTYLATLAASVGTSRARLDADVRSALARLESGPGGATGDPDLDLYSLEQRGIARLLVGAYDGSVDDLQRVAVMARAAGRDAMLVDALSYLAGTFASMDDLPAARQYATEAANLAERRGWGRARSVAHAWILLGWTASLRGDVATAETAAARVLASMAPQNGPDIELAARSLELYIFAHQGDAYALLQRYMRHYAGLALADVSPALIGYAAPVILQICLDLGERRWARTIADTAITRAPDPGEAALLRAMLQVDAGQPAAAKRELAGVLDETQTCHLTTTKVRVWLLAAAIEQHAGNLVLAHERLRRALELAEPAELLQPFTESTRFAALLIGGTGRFGRSEAFVDTILQHLPATPPGEPDRLMRLTPAELEILRDLPSLLSLREIAEARSISVNTVKSHLRAIYRKLDVDGRRSAVQAARSRGLL